MMFLRQPSIEIQKRSTSPRCGWVILSSLNLFSLGFFMAWIAQSGCLPIYIIA